MAGAEGTRKALCDESPYELGVFWEIGEPIGIRHRNQEREAESGATKRNPGPQKRAPSYAPSMASRLSRVSEDRGATESDEAWSTKRDARTDLACCSRMILSSMVSWATSR